MRLGRLIHAALYKGGHYETGADGVYPYALLRVLQRCALGQPENAMLGRHVGRRSREADCAKNGSHVHDCPATALHHARNLVTHAVKDAVEVDTDYLLP